MSRYIQDSDNAAKQVPNLRAELVREAGIPAPLVIQPRPNHVIINNSGSYAFLYTSTGSSGGTSHYNADDSTAGNEIWVTGSYKIHGSAGGHGPFQLKLDINPVAWRQTDATISGTTGDVTFVFNAKSVQKRT
mgnify:CR=1 FL=1|tara:strand:+ start:2199 stop:2597 length:399 start_codon:yes stop_codon:yes gene_type:complete